MQPLFRKRNLFRYLPLVTLFLVVMAFDDWLQSVEVRSNGPAREAAVRFTPVRFDPAGFGPLRLAGAWRVDVDDPRFGGVSALGLDGGSLLAVTDSGSVIRLPVPGKGARALVRDLPDGPGTPQFKFNRDSEALARDPAGRGWWVAFENWNQLWLYDPSFRRALTRIDFGEDRWGQNRGIEAIVADAEAMLLFPQTGREWLRLRGRTAEAQPLVSPYGDFGDGLRLTDGRLLLVTRKFGLNGLVKKLVIAEMKGGRLAVRPIARLNLGVWDNVEGIAAEPRVDGGTRLWLMTDNDFRPRKATLLVALDLP